MLRLFSDHNCPERKMESEKIEYFNKFGARLLFWLIALKQYDCIVAANVTSPEVFHLIGNKTVQVEEGFLIGRIWNLDDGKAVIFRGVPYAEPPIGEFRFKKPVAKRAWEGPRLAHKYGSACIQFMGYHKSDRYSAESMARESEDCLYLNIFAPEEGQTANPYPVLVWIHGGSFLAGSGDTGMDDSVIFRNFVFKGIILITMNYRLGPHGFISTDGPEMRGNLGLWDQIAALEWINKNIEAFGGDPTNVTIMGESAGGASVSILAVSPKTQNIVHRVVEMSGSAAAAWAIERQEKSLWDVKNVLEYLTCRKQFVLEDLLELFDESDITGDRAPKYDCPLVRKKLHCPKELSKSEAWECFRKGADFTDIHFRKALTVELGISKAIVDDEIIPANVTSITDELPRMPIMAGVAHLEWGHKKEKYYGFYGSFRNSTEKERQLKIAAVIEQSFKPRFSKQLPNTTFELVGNATYFHYLTSKGGTNKQWDVRELVKVLQQIESDVEFIAPCVEECNSYADHGYPVYLYSFERLPPGGLYEDEEGDKRLFGHEPPKRTRARKFTHAFHGLDHAYIFTEGYSSNLHFSYDNDDKIMSHTFTQLITNFVKFGNPTPYPIQGALWLPYTKETPRFMKLNVPLKLVEDDFHWEDVSFWNDQALYLSNYAAIDDPERTRVDQLSIDERHQLNAYRRAWWALWILVASIAVVLWSIVIFSVGRRCMKSQSHTPYKSIVLTEA